MDRVSIYRKCRLEEIALPLREGRLSDIPMDEVCTCGCWSLHLMVANQHLQNLRQDMGMDVDGEDTTQVVREVEDFGLVVDFAGIDEDDLVVSSTNRLTSGSPHDWQNPRFGEQLDTKIQTLTTEIDHMAPNMKATERLGDVAEKLKEAEAESDLAKKASKAARDRFNEVRRER